jgi:hypothetical protein
MPHEIKSEIDLCSFKTRVKFRCSVAFPRSSALLHENPANIMMRKLAMLSAEAGSIYRYPLSRPIFIMTD